MFLDQRRLHRLLLALLALAIVAPRFGHLADFYIQDEHLWINRAHLYADAMLAADLTRATAFELRNHPAITLLSLVGPTMQIYAARHNLENTYEHWSIDHRRLAAGWARLVMGLAASGVLLAIWRQFSHLRYFRGQPVNAGVVAALIGLEPWVWGVTRTVIVDTLMALCLVASLIAGAIAQERRQYRWIALSGMWWALAFLSKSPALIVLPVTLALATCWLPWDWRRLRNNLAVWLASMYVTLCFVWPPFLFHPIERFQGVFARVTYHTSTPEVYTWPGLHPPFFIYVLSAMAAVGCLVYVVLRLLEWRTWRRQLLIFDVLLVSSLLFAGTLIVVGGDHARKNVPALAMLAAVGAAGWLLFLRHGWRRWPLLPTLLIVAQLVFVGSWFPHLTSFHSPLFRSESGKRLLVDVGNGSRLLADYLNWQPEPIVAATAFPGLVSPYVRADRRSNLRRLPREGKLGLLEPDVTHVIVPESYLARFAFDAAARTLVMELREYQPETVIKIRDVPLFAVYRLAR